MLNNIINFYKVFSFIKNILILYIFYCFTVKCFNISYFFKFNKTCVSDTLFVLYVLSSNTLTFWFFFFVFSFLWLWKAKNVNWFMYLLYVIFWFYFLPSNLCCNYVDSVLSIQSINTTLQNGLLTIHPIMIYISYAATLTYWLSNFYYFKVNFISNNSTTNVFTFFGLIIAGVYLGAFWASQELNWGGFWSWDPVEIVSLFLFFWFMLLMHKRTKNFINKPINHAMIIIVLIYFIIRLGVVNTIHSFIRSNNNPYFVFISVLFMLILFFNNTLKYYHLVKHKYSTWFFILWSLLIIYLYLYIFMLINWLDSILISPITMYFLLVIFSIYLLTVYSFTKVNKSFLIQIWLFYLTAFIFAKTINFIMYLVFLSVCAYLTFKNLRLHLYFLYTYVIFFLFFVNLPFYTNNINLFNLNFYINSVSNSITLNDYYESFFFLKKHLVISKLKNQFAHVSGFTIISNSWSSLFIFSKNIKIYHLFSLEIIFVTIFIFCTVIVTNTFNYKYKKGLQHNKKY